MCVLVAQYIVILSFCILSIISLSLPSLILSHHIYLSKVKPYHPSDSVVLDTSLGSYHHYLSLIKPLTVPAWVADEGHDLIPISFSSTAIGRMEEMERRGQFIYLDSADHAKQLIKEVTTTNIYIYVYIYIYMCVCMYVCM